MSQLQRFSTNLEAFRKILVNGIWIAVILLVLASLGWFVMSLRTPEQPVATDVTTDAVRAPIEWAAVDREIGAAFGAANDSTAAYASARLGEWIDVLVQRVDDDFLDWYFNYWNQQLLGLQSLWYASVHRVFEEQPTAAERITEKIQIEFATRVLKPQLAQLELENIVRDVMDYYVVTLRANLQAIPERFSIPQAQWERYLSDVALLAADTEGNRQVPVTLKTIYAAGAGGAVVLGAKVTGIVAKIGSKIAVKSAGKAATQVAMKTGAKVAAKGGGKLLGPIVGIGIIIWDVWDHDRTESQNRPVLRQTLLDYFAEMKQSLLHDGDTGILAVLYEMERTAHESLDRRTSE